MAITAELLTDVMAAYGQQVQRSPASNALYSHLVRYVTLRMHPRYRANAREVAGDAFMRVVGDLSKLMVDHAGPVDLAALIQQLSAGGRLLTPEAFVKKRATWAVLAYLTAERPEPELLAGEHLLEPHTAHLDMVELIAVKRTLRRLDLEDLELLTYAIQHSDADAAEALTISETAYRKRLSRLRHEIREELKESPS